MTRTYTIRRADRDLALRVAERPSRYSPHSVLEACVILQWYWEGMTFTHPLPPFRPRRAVREVGRGGVR